MREIKFRAWDVGTKDMRTVNAIGWKTGCVAVAIGSQSAQLHFDQAVLMQFTGLKDNNGKEIYEGDVLNRVIGHTVHRASVTFEGGRFVTTHPGGGIGWTVNSSTSEVIGNIYENPELLTP